MSDRRDDLFIRHALLPQRIAEISRAQSFSSRSFRMSILAVTRSAVDFEQRTYVRRIGMVVLQCRMGTVW